MNEGMTEDEAKQLLSNIYTLGGAQFWWTSRNRMLGGESAAWCWRHGRRDDVIRVINVLIDGAFA